MNKKKSALKTCISILFKKEGGKPLRRSKMAFVLAMDLRLFPLEQANNLIDLAISSGHLKSILDSGENAIEEDISKTTFIPNFTWEDIETPNPFKPSYEDIASSIKSIPVEEDQPVEEISKEKTSSKDEIFTGFEIDEELLRRASELEKVLNIFPETATLVAMKENNMKITQEILNKVEQIIFKKKNNL